MCKVMAFVLMMLLSSTAYPQYYISWSPDGTQLVFSNVDGSYLMSSDGSLVRKMKIDVSSSPSWLPDGRIVFRGEGGLYSVDPDGDHLEPFSKGFSVSPSGKRALFFENSLLKIANLDDQKVTELFTYYDTDRLLSSYVWSPDSAKIAFQIAHGQGISTTVLLTVLPYNGTVAENSGSFSWSPDSKEIAFDKISDEERDFSLPIPG